jgi:hypothetical protein
MGTHDIVSVVTQHSQALAGLFQQEVPYGEWKYALLYSILHSPPSPGPLGPLCPAIAGCMLLGSHSTPWRLGVFLAVFLPRLVLTQTEGQRKSGENGQDAAQGNILTRESP